MAGVAVFWVLENNSGRYQCFFNRFNPVWCGLKKLSNQTNRKRFFANRTRNNSTNPTNLKRLIPIEHDLNCLWDRTCFSHILSIHNQFFAFHPIRITFFVTARAGQLPNSVLKQMCIYVHIWCWYMKVISELQSETKLRKCVILAVIVNLTYAVTRKAWKIQAGTGLEPWLLFCQQSYQANWEWGLKVICFTVCYQFPGSIAQKLCTQASLERVWLCIFLRPRALHRWLKNHREFN